MERMELTHALKNNNKRYLYLYINKLLFKAEIEMKNYLNELYFA